MAEPKTGLKVVERIGAFAAGARAGHLKPDAAALLKRNVLDSLGCAIAALPGRPFAALREQFAEFRAPGRCTLIGGGRTSPDQAALYNAGLVRYVDLLDSFMSPGGLCHPSDNLAAVLAAAEDADASGSDFLLALAVAYEVQCRITAVVPVMALGFNHAIQLAVSSAAAVGRLQGLDAAIIADAIAIATVDNVSLTCVHAEPVSRWKGFSPGMTTMRSIYAVGLARRGFTGPLGLFEGPNGLDRMFGRTTAVDWEDPSLDVVARTVLKKYCSLIHGQPVIEAVLDLKRRHALAAGDVAGVTCRIFQTGFDIAGGGGFGSKDAPRTKEQADYNRRYLIAAALLDDRVGPAQLEPSRINAPDAQALLARVSVVPDEALTRRYPDELCTRIELRLRDGRTFEVLQTGYEGSLVRPTSWARAVEKFHWLSEPHAEAALRQAIVDAVETLERTSVRQLTALLASVEREPVHPTTHPGIQ